MLRIPRIAAVAWPVLLACMSVAQTESSRPPGYGSGHDLVHAMHAAYAPDKWYRHFTFSQEVDFYRNDSVVKREVWHEAYRPGGLLIKVGTKNSGTGRVYSNFKVHAFVDGKETQVSRRVHELLLVGLDIYFFSPAQTIRLLDSLGYDLSKIRTDEFRGRKVYVVGADKGDDTSRQFWIDAPRITRITASPELSPICVGLGISSF